MFRSQSKFSQSRSGVGVKHFRLRTPLIPRGGTGSGLPESTPRGFCVFLSDTDPESNISEKTGRGVKRNLWPGQNFRSTTQAKFVTSANNLTWSGISLD